MKKRGGLRIEMSKKSSGNLLNQKDIEILKEDNYKIIRIDLDGDAPKQFIKAYFFTPNSTVRKSKSSSWIPYIAKTAEKYYPHESVIEFMINRIGQVLGLYMNDIKLVNANGQIRFLSRYFKHKNERLVHGAEICGEYLEDYELAKEIANNKSNSRELFTFEFIKDAIRNVYPDCFEDLTLELIRMISFDAIVGNNDRHFYNWGVIDTLKKTTKLPTFAPIFDSARGLLWNESDEQIIHTIKTQKQGSKKLENYILNACPRISTVENTKANHFELIEFLKSYSREYKQIIDEMTCLENENRVLETIEKEFKKHFIPERFSLTTQIIKSRFETIRKI